MSSSALAVMDGGSGVTLWRKPEQILAEAKEAATALISVVNQKPNPVIFNNERYLEREDWGTLAKFFGCTAKTVETRYVNFDGIKGWEAVAVCIDSNFNEIGRSESMCLSDEPTWGDVPVYAWKDVLDDKGKKIWDGKLRGGKGGYKAEKIQTGTAPKPLFQLRSMAQTRAEAKVLKSVFGWVAVLAGYKPTVAEEMTGNERELNEEQEPEKPKPTVQRKSEKATSGLPPMNAAPPPPPPPTSKAICAECRYTEGHAPDCSYSFIPADAGDAYEPPEKGAEPEPAKTESDQSREEQWKNFAGHDVKKHINWKQGKLLFMVQSKKGITEEQMKDYLLKNLKVEHRPLIEWKDFQGLLTAMDPDCQFHQENKK